MQLQNLLSHGYLPKELPPPFTSESFGSFVGINGPLTVGGRTSSSALITKPCQHNLARPGNLRRILSIPHPFNYYKVCELLTNNWKDVELSFSRSSISLTTPIEDRANVRAAIMKEDGGSLPKFRAKNRACARHILITDISRWYHTIYTHSIPWALIGKQTAKTQRKSGFGNELDKALRNCQDGQTLGLPVGPDASLIVAEIIGSTIDSRLQDIGLKGFRFMDDFEFAFDTRSEAESALPEIEKVLCEYELAINPSKTSVEDLPHALDHEWTLFFKNFPFTRDAQEADLVHYFDRAFQLRKKFPQDRVLSYAVARLRSVSVDPDAEEVFQDLLMQCIMVEPGTLQGVIWHLDQINRLSFNLITPKFAEVINFVIRMHAPLFHGSEVAWALWAAIIFQIPIEDSAAISLSSSDDSIVALLALHARVEGLISQEIHFHKWANKMTTDSLHNGNWLLAYEADIKGWLPSKESKNHVDSNPYMSILKQAGVTFYNTEVNDSIAGYVYMGDYDEEPFDNNNEKVPHSPY